MAKDKDKGFFEGLFKKEKEKEKHEEADAAEDAPVSAPPGSLAGMGRTVEVAADKMLSADPDGDGLSTGLEIKIGTDPTRRDSDSDGFDDQAEHLGGTNPRKSDSDGDGLPDTFEIPFGTATNPTQGMPGVPLPKPPDDGFGLDDVFEAPGKIGQIVQKGVEEVSRWGKEAKDAAEKAGKTGAAKHKPRKPEPDEEPDLKEFLENALAQQGDTFRMGAEASGNDADPDAFDASELVQWAADRAGTNLPDGSWRQYQSLHKAKSTMDVDEALEIPGTLVFHFSRDPLSSNSRPPEAHVAISLGNGYVLEATTGGVRIAEAGDRFEYAAKVPGFAEQYDTTEVAEWMNDQLGKLNLPPVSGSDANVTVESIERTRPGETPAADDAEPRPSASLEDDDAGGGADETGGVPIVRTSASSAGPAPTAIDTEAILKQAKGYREQGRALHEQVLEDYRGEYRPVHDEQRRALYEERSHKAKAELAETEQNYELENALQTQKEMAQLEAKAKKLMVAEDDQGAEEAREEIEIMRARVEGSIARAKEFSEVALEERQLMKEAQLERRRIEAEEGREWKEWETKDDTADLLDRKANLLEDAGYAKLEAEGHLEEAKTARAEGRLKEAAASEAEAKQLEAKAAKALKDAEAIHPDPKVLQDAGLEVTPIGPAPIPKLVDPGDPDDGPPVAGTAGSDASSGDEEAESDVVGDVAVFATEVEESVDSLKVPAAAPASVATADAPSFSPADEGDHGVADLEAVPATPAEPDPGDVAIHPADPVSDEPVEAFDDPDPSDVV